MPVHEFDPETLQRLVDGELEYSAVGQLIDLAQDNPESWRTMALSFIEDQQFRKSFESFAVASESDGLDRVTTPLAKPQTSTRFSALRILATAAGLAAALTIGFILGGNSDAPVQNNRNNLLTATTPDPIQTENAVTTADFEPECRMELMTAEGDPVGSEVDLYRVEDFKKLLANPDSDATFALQEVLADSGFTDDARTRLSRSGYLLDEDTRYVSGRLDDGRAFVVPIRSIRLNTSH